MPDGHFVGVCFHCKCEMWLPTALHQAASHSQHISFYCAYGHPQIFAKGETELDKMRRERDRLYQQVAQRDDEIKVQGKLIENLKEQRKTLEGQAVKARTRAKAGVCPCCNRTFRQMALHMRNKHPDFKAAKAA